MNLRSVAIVWLERSSPQCLWATRTGKPSLRKNLVILRSSCFEMNGILRYDHFCVRNLMVLLVFLGRLVPSMTFSWYPLRCRMSSNARSCFSDALRVEHLS